MNYFEFFLVLTQNLFVGFLRKDGNLKQEQFSLKLHDQIKKKCQR